MTKPPAPIPITILTGFLGAGKTTLLNRLVRDDAFADTVVLINEFGEVGIDHLLVETISDDMVLLSSGCVCCTIRGELISTLEDLLRRRDNNRMPAFARVLIETTGLADPSPVLNAVLTHPYLKLRYRLDGLICVVDAVNGLDTLATHEEALHQAAVADRLLITKTDMPSAEGKIDPLRAYLYQINPGATVFDLAENGLSPHILNDLAHLAVENAHEGGRLSRWLGDFLPGKANDHTHHPHAHSYNVSRHRARIRSFALSHRAPVDPSSFEMFLDLLRANYGPNLLRLKGLVALTDDPGRPMVIHAVQHLLHPPVRLDRWPDGDHTSRLVFILKDLDETFVEKLWAAFTHQPMIDTPDAAALLDNPLRV